MPGVVILLAHVARRSVRRAMRSEDEAQILRKVQAASLRGESVPIMRIVHEMIGQGIRETRTREAMQRLLANRRIKYTPKSSEDVELYRK